MPNSERGTVEKMETKSIGGRVWVRADAHLAALKLEREARKEADRPYREIASKLECGYAFCHPEEDCEGKRAWLKAAGERDEALAAVSSTIKELEHRAEDAIAFRDATSPILPDAVAARARQEGCATGLREAAQLLRDKAGQVGGEADYPSEAELFGGEPLHPRFAQAPGDRSLCGLLEVWAKWIGDDCAQGMEDTNRQLCAIDLQAAASRLDPTQPIPAGDEEEPISDELIIAVSKELDFTRTSVERAIRHVLRSLQSSDQKGR